MRRTFRRIIVATDLTPVSIDALNRAIMLAKRDEAELLVAHVYQPPNLAQAEAVGPGIYEEWERILGEKLRESSNRSYGARAGSWFARGRWCCLAVRMHKPFTSETLGRKLREVLDR